MPEEGPDQGLLLSDPFTCELPNSIQTESDPVEHAVVGEDTDSLI